jgi:hypothetical protein
MSKSDYNYLRSLPVVLHLPSEHAFVAHGGLLPCDPTRSICSKLLQLARLPKLPLALGGGSIPTLRNAQELSILTDIKQNNDPWVVHIRNRRNVEVGIISLPFDAFVEPTLVCYRKTGKGKPWAGVWNGTMSRCAEFEPSAQVGGDSLPSYPSVMVDGHTASRGLDVHK